MTVAEHIDVIIKSTFAEIDAVWNIHREGKNSFNVPFYSNLESPSSKRPAEPSSRIIFPCLSVSEHDTKATPRVSEQEMRFIFIENLNHHIKEHHWDVYYSVETPTQHKYIFSDGKPRIADTNKGDTGVSARVDLTIHDNSGNRICYIEFKAKNVDSENIAKDLVKLKEETAYVRQNNPACECEAYFIHLLEVNQQGSSPQSDTIWNIEQKITPYLVGTSIRYVCHSLLTKQLKINNSRRDAEEDVRNYIGSSSPNNIPSNSPDPGRFIDINNDNHEVDGLIQLSNK